MPLRSMSLYIFSYSGLLVSGATRHSLAPSCTISACGETTGRSAREETIKSCFHRTFSNVCIKILVCGHVHGALSRIRERDDADYAVTEEVGARAHAHPYPQHSPQPNSCRIHRNHSCTQKIRQHICMRRKDSTEKTEHTRTPYQQQSRSPTPAEFTETTARYKPNPAIYRYMLSLIHI